MYTSYGIKDCTDGLSNTIMMAESLVGDPTSIRSSNSHNRNNGVTGLAGIGNSVQSVDASSMPWTTWVLPSIQICTAGFQAGTLNAGNIAVSGGVRWGYGGVGITMMNTVITPNSKLAPWNTCSPNTGSNGGPQGGNNDYAVFSNCQSNHPGGAQILLGDGSVRFVKDSVQQAIWYALGTRSHGDIVDASQY
jgi:prepilin-type processing-associated H-X9-DG protein